jgi:hypothetical protein
MAPQKWEHREQAIGKAINVFVGKAKMHPQISSFAERSLFFLRNNAGVKLLSGPLLPYASDFIPVLTHPPPYSTSLGRCSKRQCTCFAAISHISLENRRIRSTSALQKICGNDIRCFLVQRLGFEVGKQGLPVAFSQGSPDPKRPDVRMEEYL